MLGETIKLRIKFGIGDLCSRILVEGVWYEFQMVNTRAIAESAKIANRIRESTGNVYRLDKLLSLCTELNQSIIAYSYRQHK